MSDPSGAGGPPVAAAVITKNEEQNIGACLATLGWADELLVLDSFSEDETAAIARTYTPLVHRRRFTDFPGQRNAALALLRSDWVLFVDADERVSPELAAEVRETVATAAAPAAGFWVPRRNLILGRWMRYGGWYPDYQLRLLRVGRARYDESRKVHEVVILDGEAGHLHSHFVHYNYQRLGQIVAKQAAYAALEAASLDQRGLRARPHSIVLQPLREFRRRFFTLAGYRDGLHGLLLAAVVSLYTGVAYAKLWRRQRGGGAFPPDAEKQTRRS